MCKQSAYQSWRSALIQAIGPDTAGVLAGRRRDRATLRFRRVRSLQKFAAAHGSIHNHFEQERTLISRRSFAPQTFGSRIDVPARWSHGLNSAWPEQGWVGASSETFPDCLAAQPFFHVRIWLVWFFRANPLPCLYPVPHVCSGGRVARSSEPHLGLPEGPSHKKMEPS